MKVDQAAPVATVDELADYDAIIFGTPTRFGNMAGQMRTFLDQTGGLWMKGALVGKIGSVFASTGTQHGGQETTITSFHTTLLHHGMVIVGVPYACSGLVNMNEITGGTPYARPRSRARTAAASRARTSRHRALPGQARRGNREQARVLTRRPGGSGRRMRERRRSIRRRSRCRGSGRYWPDAGAAGAAFVAGAFCAAFCG